MSLKELSARLGSIDTKPITLEDSLSMIKPLKLEPVRAKRVKKQWFEPVRNWRYGNDVSSL